MHLMHCNHMHFGSCRPDAGPWQAFPLLSGGQQALAALALSLAVHGTLRPAWFLCDEVDAALDVRRAAHLGAYMAATPTQFLVISHKPQVGHPAQHCAAAVSRVGMHDWHAFAAEPNDQENINAAHALGGLACQHHQKQ